jgi:hypothetical protein
MLSAMRTTMSGLITAHRVSILASGLTNHRYSLSERSFKAVL